MILLHPIVEVETVNKTTQNLSCSHSLLKSCFLTFAIYFPIQHANGVTNLWDLVYVIQGHDTLLSPAYAKGIVHRKHITIFKGVSIAFWLWPGKIWHSFYAYTRCTWLQGSINCCFQTQISDQREINGLLRNGSIPHGCRKLNFSRSQSWRELL